MALSDHTPNVAAEQATTPEPAFPGLSADVLARLTQEQRAILLWAYRAQQRSQMAHLLIQAYAGSGKSTVLQWTAEMLSAMDPTIKIIAVVFNKHNAVTLKSKLPANVDVSTTHALGRRAVLRFLGQGKRWDHQDGKYRELAKEHAERRLEAADVDPADDVAQQLALLDEQERAELVRGLAKLTEMAMLTRTVTMKGRAAVATPDALYQMALLYDCDTDAAELLGELVAPIVTEGVRMVLQEGKGDFVDQLFVPASLPEVGRCVPKASFVLTDECLPHRTPVLLADGTSLPIGQIVEQKLPVSVLAYDTRTGQQRACRVTGWSRTLNRKPLVKIKARWSACKRGPLPTNFVVCTTDHKVWADGQWCAAGSVQPGMTMQVETRARKAQVYKITGAGRAVLSRAMREKNAAGFATMLHAGHVSQRGGNGHPLPLPQQTLLDALGAGWVAEHVVRTGRARSSGYPAHYKCDLANPTLRIAVEVDGQSHRGKRRELDAKKDALLSALGWLVVRVDNRRAVQETDAVVREIMAADCPIDATVESVEPVTIPDNYVYDISVEDCHNFYANGLLVHNCQDLNRCQHELARLAVGRLGRLIAVGDRQQAIMMFAGADSGGMDRLQQMFSADELPLSICWRCPASHIAEAQQIVPGIQARPGAPAGTIVRDLEVEQMLDNLRPDASGGDLVLCRMTAPLLDIAWAAIQEGIVVDFRGRAIGDSILALIKKVLGRSKRARSMDLEQFTAKLDEYERKQIAKITAKDGPNMDQAIQTLQDRVHTVRTLAGRVRALHAEQEADPPSDPWLIGEPPTTDELVAEIERMFANKTGPRVTFSTVHRAKGDERDRVWILAPDLLGPGKRDKTPEAITQARNVMYVAMTRSLDWLGYVNYRQ